MKKFLTFIFIFFLFTTTYCQNSLIAADKGNVLYIGVDNPVTIFAEGYRYDEITVKVDKGEISGNYGKYIYRGIQKGTVVFTIVSLKDSREISRTTFRVKSIPDAVVSIAGAKNETISTKALRSLMVVGTHLKDFDFDAHYMVDSFTISIVHLDKCTTKQFSIKGYELNQEIKEELTKLHKNDLVLFKDIYAIAPDATIRNLEPAVFTVTE